MIISDFFDYPLFEKNGIIALETMLPKSMEVHTYIDPDTDNLVILLRDIQITMILCKITVTLEGVELKNVQLTNNQKIAVISIIEKYYK